MKLFVKENTEHKKYLNISAPTRAELAKNLGSAYFSIDSVTYHVSQVYAEISSETAPVSTVIGGAIGLVGGMPGVLIGGLLGALFGSDADKKEDSQIELFNGSVL